MSVNVSALRAPGAGKAPVAGFVLGVLVVVGSLALSLAFGGRPTSFEELVHAVFVPDGSVADIAIRELRWPRTLNALAVGACVGVAGCLAQGQTRNPIADPGLLGIYPGAALAIVAGSLLPDGSGTGTYAQAGLAFAGAVIACALVVTVGSATRHGATPLTLVLAGAAVSALAGGVVSLIVLSSDAALDTLRFWQLGSVAARGALLPQLVPLIIVGLVLAVANIGPLNALALGDDTARSLGVSVARARILGLAALAVLAAASVTLAGPLAFAGLLVPHAVRGLVGADYRWQIPGSALFGASLLLLTDTAGRVIARPGELPVGVVLAVVGAPFFIYLARRRRLVTL
ncbi:FecCD family ABC transporter permease [Arthrobacter sp. Soil762]|uniref:FecCD family ABC transporter permease n=1 Tax=Arthrobacter sp. Soil762 TaxID=1736401 RepID=UPI0009E80F11|nr:iron ABC transporter permease [Arthrobacter sp. Soil762]